MARPIKHKENDILDLLDNSFKSTLQITEEGKSRGLYKRWESYKKVLEDLYKKGLVEKLEINNSRNKQLLWRKK